MAKRSRTVKADSIPDESPDAEVYAHAIVMHCQNKRDACHLRARQWVTVRYDGTAYNNQATMATKAYCDKCAISDKRVIERLGRVEVTVRGQAGDQS